MGVWLWSLLWGFQMELVWGAGIFQPQRWPPAKARTPKAKEWTPPPSSSSASPWVPTPGLDRADPEGSEAALAFLYSGDALRLSQANCSRRFEVWAGGPPPGLRSALRGAPETLTHATNFLNLIFQTNDIRESSVREDVEWYHALVRSVVEGHPRAYRALLTFDAHPASSKPQLMLQATKENNEILLQDLLASSESPQNLSWDSQGSPGLRAPLGPSLHKRVLSNDLKSLDTPKWNRGDSYVMDASHVRWSPPFLECQESKFLPGWMVSLASSFYGLKPDLSPEFKGTVRMDVKLQAVDINQCASGPGWFTDTHQCDLNSTQCVPQESHGFVLGRYLCLCKPGFYGTSRAPGTGQSGSSPPYAGQDGAGDSGTLFACRPCEEGCATCVDDTPCLIQEDWSLRAAVLAFQACCMLAVFLSMLVSYHFRMSKRIRASGVILLETILFGSLLLYFPVFILYFRPSVFRCIVLRWVRLLGFAIVYGTITLKLYRVLKVFLSRSAQRMPYMTSGRVLKMLGLILLLVLWFLAAWTVGMLENIEKNIPLVIRSQTAKGLQFYLCDHDRWDYMMVVAEMLFLFWGSFLCYATRTVPSAFHEPRYMGIALHNEMIISAAFHVVRFVMVPSLHPDWTLLLFFIHTHVTITTTLALLFIPKFLHAKSSLREEIAAEVYEDELDMRRSGSYLNNSITSAWSEHSLDPDDIRDELKKLYTQLEVHKTKKMTANNPHLQKKRSSRKGLGRSIMRRLTEIPESMSRQCGREDRESSGGGGGGGSRSGSYKRWLLDSGSSSVKVKEDSKHKAFSLRKSHSTYDHVWDSKEGSSPARHDSVCKEPPLLDTLMRKKLAKKASERTNGDSLDSAPLVYKSASAHNLLADKKPLHPKPSPLQKSLSVLMSAREKALLFTSRAYLEDGCEQAGEKEGKEKEGASPPETQSSGGADSGEAANQAPEAGKQPQSDVAKGTVTSLPQDSFDRATVCPWEGEVTPPESKAQKHVTYAPIKSISVDNSHLLGRAPPAGKRTPPQPPVRYQSLAHNLERSEVAPWDSQEQTRPDTDTPGQGSQVTGALLYSCPQEAEEPAGKMEKAERGEDNLQPPSAPGDGRLRSVPSFAAEICPWELAEEEALDQSQQDKPSEPDSSLGKAQSLKVLPQKNSLKSLGLAIKAFNRAREKSSIKGKEEEEGSQREKEKEKEAGSRRDKPKLAETSMLSIGGTARQEATARSPKGSRQKISKQATICPWEEENTTPPQQNNNTSKMFEICPWEASVEEADGPHDGSVPAKASSRAERRSSKGPGGTICRKLERARSQWESMCPWETIDSGGAPQHLSTEEDQPSHPSKTDGKNPEAHPWEPAEVITGIKNELRPVGAPEAPPAMQDKDRAPKGDKSTTLKAAAGPGKTLAQGSSQREAVCPWESLDARESSAKPDTKSTDLPKEVSEKSDSVQSRKAEVCPWEMEEDEASVTAETYPREVADTPAERGTIKHGDKPGLSKGDKSTPLKAAAGPCKTMQQEFVCPWESLDVRESSAKPDTKSTDLPKEVSKKSDSVQSRKAEVCPWETEEVETSVSAETYPWEVADAPSEKGTLLREVGAASKEDKSIRSKPIGPSKTLEKGSRQWESICPWETMDVKEPSIKPASKSLDLSKATSKKSDSADNKKTDVCPWESAEVETSIQMEICPWEAAEAPSDKRKVKQDRDGVYRASSRETGATPPKKFEMGGSQRESVCPWESMDMEELSVKPATRSLDLYKAASKKSHSVESKKAEICPWENADPEASVKTEICPWEAAKTPPEKETQEKVGLSKGDQRITLKAAADLSKTLEKGSSQRESTCPWESMSVEDSFVKMDSKSFEGPSKKSSSVESKKADVCPWESEEVEASVRAEICPWEASETPSDKGKLRQDTSVGEETSSRGTGDVPSKKLEKESSQRESICPWEDSSRTTDPGKTSSRKSDSVESKKSDVCPWEGLDPKAVEKESLRAEICPWDVEGALPSQTEKRAGETASTVVTKTPTAQPIKSRSKPMGQAEHKPLHRLLPDPKPPRGFSKAHSMVADVLPWEVGVAPILTRCISTGGSAMADICPWEAEGAPMAAAKDGVETSKTSAVSPLEAGDGSPVCAPPPDSKTAEKQREETRAPSPTRSDVCPWDGE